MQLPNVTVITDIDARGRGECILVERKQRDGLSEKLIDFRCVYDYGAWLSGQWYDISTVIIRWAQTTGQLKIRTNCGW
jgi:hypothetical protein